MGGNGGDCHHPGQPCLCLTPWPASEAAALLHTCLSIRPSQAMAGGSRRDRAYHIILILFTARTSSAPPPTTYQTGMREATPTWLRAHPLGSRAGDPPPDHTVFITTMMNMHSDPINICSGPLATSPSDRRTCSQYLKP